MPENEERVHHPVFARAYSKASVGAERRGQAEHRRRLLAGVAGRVIEVGAGNGLNFAYYPSSVKEVVAVEPEPYLRARAEESARARAWGAGAGVAIRVLDGLADRLPAHDETFDVGVASLLLCSVSNPDAALAELFRVIRPGGELRFYEHVVSRHRPLALLEGAFSRALYRHLAGGCHLDRDTAGAIERAGFRIESCERFPYTPFPFPPRVTHVLGTARHP